MDNFNATQPRQSADARAPMTPIKGSWEDKLVKGQQLIAVQNDDGIAVLADLIDRLSSLPEPQRRAANNRLAQILLVAINDLIPYLAYREQFDRAAHYTLVGERLANPEDRPIWQTHRSNILMAAGQFDECFDLMRTIAQTDSVRSWCLFALEATRQGRIDIAERVCAELEEATNRERTTAAAPEKLRPLSSVYGYAKAVTMLAQGDLQNATAWMHFSLANDDVKSHHDLVRFYTHLIEYNHLEESLDWIEQDHEHPVRANFWHGFVANHLGRHAEARKRWKLATETGQTRVNTSQRIDGTELILAIYYLGDKDGMGLGIVLNSMTGESSILPAQFYLAGLGWALRDDQRAAHSNFQLAYTRNKSLAMGKALPTIWWRICQDLIPESTLPDYARYFVHDTTASTPLAHTEA